jgi:hypothetical protein
MFEKVLREGREIGKKDEEPPALTSKKRGFGQSLINFTQDQNAKGSIQAHT